MMNVENAHVIFFDCEKNPERSVEQLVDLHVELVIFRCQRAASRKLAERKDRGECPVGPRFGTLRRAARDPTILLVHIVMGSRLDVNFVVHGAPESPYFARNSA